MNLPTEITSIAIALIFVVVLFGIFLKIRGNGKNGQNGFIKAEFEKRLSDIENNHLHDINGRFDKIDGTLGSIWGEISNLKVEQAKMYERLKSVETKLKIKR